MLNLPTTFIERAKGIMGDEYEQFVLSLSEPPPVSIRLNPFKRIDKFSGDERIAWSQDGKYLAARPSFTLDPLFHAGCYYVQDASSQFVEQAFLQAKKFLQSPLTILDLCAAPGGKSTHLLSLMDADDLLISNEVIPSRNAILRQNIMKWGCANVFVTQNEPEIFGRLKGFFDVVLIDAPCSGEGLFRKDNEAINEWSPDAVYRCSVRQKEILSHAFEALAPGGFLIYCTCTFEREENDDQVEILIRNHNMIKIDIENIFQGIANTEFGYSFYPHRMRGEGFYISMLQKDKGTKFRMKNVKAGNDRNNYRKYLENYLLDANGFSPVFKDGRLYAISLQHMKSFHILSDSLYFRMAGILMGEIKGEDFVPSESLALSNFLAVNLPYCNVSEGQAIGFLRGDTTGIPDALIGWNVIRFENHSLGWVKNLGNRMNNYYPKEWRIRK